MQNTGRDSMQNTGRDSMQDSFGIKQALHLRSQRFWQPERPSRINPILNNSSVNNNHRD